MASNDIAPSAVDNPAGAPMRVLQIAFCLMVIVLAVFQFSENTADPDLWGHVIFGEEILHTRSLSPTEIYSWTAHGQPWINHELTAELSLGIAHSTLGGLGLLLLKVAVGMLTFLLCVWIASEDLAGPRKLWAWAFGALAVVEISFGFAARPQIFTALLLVLELLVLRRIHAGKLSWAFYLPVLFLIWINTHGGVLVGIGLLNLAALATIAHFLFRQVRGELSPDEIQMERRRGLFLWLALIVSLAALLCNPWRTVLLQWIVVSVLWSNRPIDEWTPTPLGWDHAAFFIVLALTVFAWLFTRRRRSWWEMLACAAFAVVALKAVRNSPLFCLVALALVPAHLADALARFSHSFARLIALTRSTSFQKITATLLVIVAVGIGIATFTLHKEHPLTMEVPRSKYPVAAIEFMRANQLRGKVLNFFDWGEMLIFELPDCPPSVDGRLDTCYSRELLAAHWNLYNNEPLDKKVLNPGDADFALLPPRLAGTRALAQQPGWRVVYFDQTAMLLARDAGRFPTLASLKLPVQGPPEASIGRAAISEKSPRWALGRPAK